MLLKRRTGNGKINKWNKKHLAMKQLIGLVLGQAFFCLFFLFSFVLFCFYFAIPRARSPFPVPFIVTSHHQRVQRPLAFGFSWESANRKLQFAVTRLQFHVAGISNFSKTFIVQCRHVVFRRVKVLTFITQKTGKIHLFEFKIQQAHRRRIKKATSAFKRDAVQFLVSLP